MKQSQTQRKICGDIERDEEPGKHRTKDRQGVEREKVVSFAAGHLSVARDPPDPERPRNTLPPKASRDLLANLWLARREQKNIRIYAPLLERGAAERGLRIISSSSPRRSSGKKVGGNSCVPIYPRR